MPFIGPNFLKPFGGNLHQKKNVGFKNLTRIESRFGSKCTLNLMVKIWLLKPNGNCSSILSLKTLKLSLGYSSNDWKPKSKLILTKSKSKCWFQFHFKLLGLYFKLKIELKVG